MKGKNQILMLLVMFLNLFEVGNCSTETQNLVQKMEQNKHIIIEGNEAFKSFVLNELKTIENNKVGYQLLNEMNESMTKTDRHVTIVPVDYTDSLYEECGLIPQSCCDPLSEDKKEVKVHIFNLTDEEALKHQQKVCYVGFSFNSNEPTIERIKNDPYHITIFHELNHARIILKTGETDIKTLIDGEINDINHGSLNTKIIDKNNGNDEKNHINNIMGFSNTCMEEFQNIGYTVTKRECMKFEDPICENTYRYGCFLSNSDIKMRYPYVAVTNPDEEISWCFAEESKFMEICQKIKEAYEKL